MNGASDYDYYAISARVNVWLDGNIDTAVITLIEYDDNILLLYASTSYLIAYDIKPYRNTRKKQRPLTIYNTIIQNICHGHTQV